MDKKVLVILLIVSVAINVATMVTLGYFWVKEHTSQREILAPPYMAPDWQHTRLARELKLSDDQIEKIRKANEEMRNAMQPLRESLFERRRELMSLLRDEKPDRNRADALLEEIAELQAQHDEYIFDRLLKMRDVLTVEQQQRLGVLLHTLHEEMRPPGMPHRPIMPHRHFGLPRGEKGR